jgi:hypothetical protein
MKLVLVVLALSVISACNADLIRPKTILRAGTFSFNLTGVQAPHTQKTYIYRVDPSNELLRVDYAAGGALTIILSDYKSKLQYVIFGNKTMFYCSTKHNINPNPFQEDMFAKAIYGGVQVINDHVTNIWKGFELDGERFTAYLDLFDNTVVNFSNDELVTTVTVLNGTTPDAALFKIPLDLVSCNSAFDIPRLY